jgi:CheY-like chemotaxis protein
MSKSAKLNFFSRKLPEKIKDDEKIDSNRGEGFLLSYYEWINLGGTVNVLNSEINIGTEFLIKIKGLYENEKFILTKTQINLINEILNTQNKKKVLLIDDSLLNLKILSLKIIRETDKNYKHSNFPTLTPDEWQNIGIIQIENDEFVFLLLSNGMYGREISMIIEPELIITDIQMPALNGIEMIKDLLKYNIKTKIIINSAYLDKDNEEINGLIQKNNIMFIEKGSNYDFIKKIFI